MVVEHHCYCSVVVNFYTKLLIFNHYFLFKEVTEVTEIKVMICAALKEKM